MKRLSQSGSSTFCPERPELRKNALLISQSHFSNFALHVINYKNVFTKGYEANFIKEIYEITKVIRGRPNVYELKDAEDGEPIFGKFYEEELSAVSKRIGSYKVGKIFKKKNGMALVKWHGYDDREAGSRSWISLSEAEEE